MRPIPQTIEAVAALASQNPDSDLLATLQSMGERVQAVVPDCVGISLAWTEHGVTFTLAATEEEFAVLDALQYLQGGPCVQAVEVGHGIQASQHDLFDEDAWQLFAHGTAAAGVRSTITFPLADHGVIVGSANLYGASDRAFLGHESALAHIIGGLASAAIRNADLSFSTRRAAEEAPDVLDREDALSRAIGYLAAVRGLDLTAAHEQLREAARRAGISEFQIAKVIDQLRP